MSVMKDHLIKARGLIQQAQLEIMRAHTAAFDEGSERICRASPEIQADLRKVEEKIGLLAY